MRFIYGGEAREFEISLSSMMFQTGGHQEVSRLVQSPTGLAPHRCAARSDSLADKSGSTKTEKDKKEGRNKH